MNLRRIKDGYSISTSDVVIGGPYTTSESVLSSLKGYLHDSDRVELLEFIKEYGENSNFLDQGVELVVDRYKDLYRRLDGLLPKTSRANISKRFLNRSGFMADIFNIINNDIAYGNYFFPETIDKFRDLDGSGVDKLFSRIDLFVQSAVVIMFDNEILGSFDSKMEEVDSIINMSDRLAKLDWFTSPTVEEQDKSEALWRSTLEQNRFVNSAIKDLKKISNGTNRNRMKSAYAITAIEHYSVGDKQSFLFCLDMV